MATSRRNGDTSKEANAIGKSVEKAVVAQVRKRAARGGLELRFQKELVQEASIKALAMVRRRPVANVNAVAKVAVDQAVVDMWRSRFRRDGDLNMAVVEENSRLPGGPDEFVSVRLGEGTEAEVLRQADKDRRSRFATYLFAAVADEKEALLRALLLKRLLIAAQPTPADRTLLFDAFADEDHSLADLARMNGGVTK
ncbi:MAG: hypothetical protein RJA51_1606, partial [Actinomycetota bacterium]